MQCVLSVCTSFEQIYVLYILPCISIIVESWMLWFPEKTIIVGTNLVHINWTSYVDHEG